MDFESMLNQTAVYWGSPQSDGYGGALFAEGIEIAVRWEDKSQLYINAAGEEKVSQAIVYTQTAIEVRGRLLFGTLDSLDSASIDDPSLENNAYEIKARTSDFSLDGSEVLYLAVL
jgi:hypothetical protein